MSMDTILRNRGNVEGLLVGTLLKDLTLFADVKLKESDFMIDKTKFFYSLGKTLCGKYTELDEVSVASYIEANSTLKSKYLELGGWNSLNGAISIGNVKNFEKYYDDLQKSNLIVSLYDKGFSVCNKVTVGGKEVIPFELFNEMNTEQVHGFYELLLNESSIESIGGVKVENLFLDENDIEDFKSGNNSGTPYNVICRWEDEQKRERYVEASKELSRLTNGVTDSNGVFFVGAYSGTGKTTFTLVNVAMGLVESGSKCIIISNEQQSKYYKLILVSWVCQNVFNQYKITRKKIEKWSLTEEEEEYVYKANKFLKDRIYDNLVFVNLDVCDVDKVMKVAKKLNLAYGFDTLIYETMKVEDAKSSNTVGEMVDVSRRLDLFGKQMKMKIICPIQCATYSENKTSYLTSSVLATSKQIKEVANVMLLIRKVMPEELEKDNKMFMKPYKLEKNAINKKWERKYIEEFDLTKQYRLIFVDKNREGDDQLVLLYEFNGRSGTFTEIGYAERVFKGQLSY